MKKILILLTAFALVLTGCTAQGSVQSMTDDTIATEEKNMDDESTSMEKADEQEDKSMESEETEENFLDAVLTDIDGNEWNLAKLDQKSVVKVWASWCSICLSGMNEFNDFAGTYEYAKVLSVVSPNMFGEQNKEDFIAWFKSLDDYDNIVVILDEEGLLINTLGIRGFPTYVYIDSSGYVENQAIGHQSTVDVIAKLESIN